MPDDFEAALRLIEADRLARFARTFDRYTRTELAEVGESVTAIPEASAAVARHFALTAHRSALQAQLRARLDEFDAAARAAAKAATHALARRHAALALNLRRAIRANLRVASPRAPAQPRQA